VAQLDEIRTRLRSESRLEPTDRVEVALADDVLTVEGEVGDLARKRRLLARAAGHPAVTGIVDRLRVRPARPMGDGEIRDHVRDALVAEPAFLGLGVHERVKDEVVLVRAASQQPPGDVCVAVDDGVVTLSGAVPSLAHKRLAGVLVWWVPGGRDVVNALEVVPAQADSDDEITDAVRMALEKDPFVGAGQVRVTTRGRVVTLAGVVPKEAEREMAERDAWCVAGVDDVRNELLVRAGEVAGAPPEVAPARPRPVKGGLWRPRGTETPG
jgi:osmotically-inducible protein OsmY